MQDQKLLKAYKEFTLELAKNSRRIILEELAKGLSIETKQDKSFVTSIDKKIEEILSEKILSKYPDHGIIGEEFGEINPSADFIWTLDPIDGTEELVNGVPTYGTIISLLHREVPIIGLVDHSELDLCTIGAKGLGVYTNGKKLAELSKPSTSPRLYIASRDQFLRYGDKGELFDLVAKKYSNLRIYKTCYSFTGVINDQADIVVEYGLKIWDLAAVEVLIKEVGGDFVKIEEQSLPSGLRVCGAVFGKKELVTEVLEYLRI